MEQEDPMKGISIFRPAKLFQRDDSTTRRTSYRVVCPTCPAHQAERFLGHGERRCDYLIQAQTESTPRRVEKCPHNHGMKDESQLGVERVMVLCDMPEFRQFVEEEEKPRATPQTSINAEKVEPMGDA
jgi:hypothetical protein